MIDFHSGIWLYSTIAITLLIAVLSIARMARTARKNIAFLAMAMVAGAALFAAEHAPQHVVILLEVGIVVFNGLLTEKTPLARNTYVSLSLLYVVLVHWMGFVLLSQAMLIGLLSGISNLKEYSSGIVNRKVEVSRDLFHIGAGVILMALFMLTSIDIAISMMFLIILGGIFMISVAEMYRGSRHSGIFYMMERSGSSLGRGALWLALGALFAVSFLGVTSILAVFSAIFIGDPIATLVGIRFGGFRLPYNKRKTVAGTLAYFAATSLVSYPFIGAYAILVGAVGAVIEGLRFGIDDNFTVSVVLTAMLMLL